MARTTTKKKKTKKKTQKKKTKKPAAKDDDLSDLEDEIDADLEKEFDYDKGKKPKSKAESLVGKTVTFEGDDGMVTGKVTKQKGKNLTIADAADGSGWEAEVADVTVVKEKAKGKAPAKGKTKEKAKEKAKDESPKVEEEEEDDDTRPRKMLLVESIKLSKNGLRPVDKESKDYKTMFADMKKRGQRVSIVVQSFTNPLLIEGGHRLEIARELEWEEIECQEDDGCEDADDRLWNGLLDNSTRVAMHWTDQARAFQRLIKGGKYNASKIGKALGMKQSTVSRMVGALKLPVDVLEVARSGDHQASAGVFQELASAPKKVIKELTEAIKSGKAVTITDVRNEKKLAAGGKKKKATGTGPKPTEAFTYRDLDKGDLGNNVRFRVTKDGVRLTAFLPWKKKTFNDFDPAIELEAQMDELYADEEVGLGSLQALNKALKLAKGELA